jgi:hypothetical protein
MIRILMPNHSDPQTFIFNEPQKNGLITEILNDLTTNKFDLVIADDSLMMNNKIAKAQQLTEWFTSGVIQDNTPILMASGLPGVDELIKRNDIITQLKQQLAQQVDQNKKLEGDLQSASREVVQMSQKVEVMKTKTDLESMSNKIMEKMNLTNMRLDDLLKAEKTNSKLKKETKQNGTAT